ncbi:MAG: hypothetical protein JKX70_02030 [Phycisphaerales bacterium]|nr:hypothetical protein [Phycisphaerales bacterium]
MKRYILAASLLFCGVVQAQPEKVIVHQDGVVEIVLHDPPLSAVEAAAIVRVPVYTEREDGSMAPGSYYTGFNQNGSHSHVYPKLIEKKPDGTWELEITAWLVHGDGAKIENRYIPWSDFAYIYDPSRRVARQDDRATFVFGSYLPVGVPDMAAKVIVHQDGDVEIVLCDPSLNTDEAAAIDSVPVFTELEDWGILAHWQVRFRGSR